MHSFYGDLSALLEEVQRQLQPGLPVAPNPGGWALPDDIVQHFQCDRSPPGQHCRLCQPLVVSGEWRGPASRAAVLAAS